MYLRVTVTDNDFDPSNFPDATHIDVLDHVGLVNVYCPCDEFAWERDGEVWVSFPAYGGDDAHKLYPEWEEWGIVSRLPEGVVVVDAWPMYTRR